MLIMYVTLCCYCNDDCIVGLLAIRTLMITAITAFFLFIIIFLF